MLFSQLFEFKESVLAVPPLLNLPIILYDVVTAVLRTLCLCCPTPKAKRKSKTSRNTSTFPRSTSSFPRSTSPKPYFPQDPVRKTASARTSSSESPRAATNAAEVYDGKLLAVCPLPTALPPCCLHFQNKVQHAPALPVASRKSTWPRS